MVFIQAKGGGTGKIPLEPQEAHGQTMTTRIRQDMERERKEKGLWDTFEVRLEIIPVFHELFFYCFVADHPGS